MSRLTDAQQDAVTAQVNANVEGRSTSADPQTWYAVHRGLTGDDANEREHWASRNLVQFMGRLSDEDFAALEKLQTVVSSNDGGAEQRRLQVITRLADEALQSAGIDPTSLPDAAPGSDAAQAARFHRALQDELSIFESKGRKPTEAEARDIVNGLKDTVVKSGWLTVNEASPTAAGSPPTDDSFHENGPPSAQGERSWITLDFDRLGHMREKDWQAAAGTGGSNGAPATEPDPGSPEYRAADAQAHDIAAEQAAGRPGGQGMAPLTEPPPGSPGYRAAEEQARKLDESMRESPGFFRQLGIAFKRFDEENKRRGAVLSANSYAQRQEKVRELQQKARDAPETLSLAEKQYLLRNGNVASDLAGAVGRLIEAQRWLDELPTSDPLRRLVEASTVGEAGALLREHPGEIARAVGVESLPALTVSLIAAVALGPVGAVALIGTDGLDGYANGLLGALGRAGVDVSNADALIGALQDKALMERVREDATTDGAIAAGVSAMATFIPGSKRPSFIRGPKNTRLPVPAGLSDEEFELFRYGVSKGLQWNSETSRRILSNLDMEVDRFLGKYRQGRIKEELPAQFRKGTLRELYDRPASEAKNTALKLLKDRRFERE